MSSRFTLQQKSIVDELLNAIWQLPETTQLAIAEKVRKKALKTQFDKFIKNANTEPDISMDEIVAEVKAVRAARYARRKK